MNHAAGQEGLSTSCWVSTGLQLYKGRFPLLLSQGLVVPYTPLLGGTCSCVKHHLLMQPLMQLPDATPASTKVTSHRGQPGPCFHLCLLVKYWSGQSLSHWLDLRSFRSGLLGCRLRVCLQLVCFSPVLPRNPPVTSLQRAAKDSICRGVSSQSLKLSRKGVKFLSITTNLLGIHTSQISCPVLMAVYPAQAVGGWEGLLWDVVDPPPA